MGWFFQPIVFGAKFYFPNLKKDGFPASFLFKSNQICGEVGMAGNIDFCH
jgi:hypothetical protein